VICDCEECRAEIGVACRTVDGEVYGLCLMHYAIVHALDVMMQSALGIRLLNDVMILESPVLEALNI
jgi:hypothetical protein